MTGTAAGAAMPLQWPLVGRHEDLDLFTATLADPRAHGFVIHGPAGVGKTRLSDQCLALAADSAGRNVARATASEGSRSVPLGALAHLLPPGIADERCDLVTIMSEVRPVLESQKTTGPLVLFVDDLHWLDITSATLLGQVVDADLVFLVATVRANEPVPGGLDSLWHRARVQRIDLHDLDRESVETLLHMVLEGPVEASTAADIWTASQGNVLFVRELVLGAIASGHLVNQHDVWRLVGPLVTTTRLHELVAARLSTLTDTAAAALDILAVWEPIGLAALEQSVGTEQLELLDQAGMLDIRIEGRRLRVRLTHPLYGEVLRDRMANLTRRRLLLAQVDRIEAHGMRRREDPIRVAAARLDATGSADRDLLVQAARLARYGLDFALVERFSRAALAHGMHAEAGLLLGEALMEVGTYEETDEVLRAAEEAAVDDPLMVHIIEMRSRNLMWGLWRDEEALAVNRAAIDRLGANDAEAIVELTLNEAMLLTYCGRPLAALDVLAAAPDTTNPRSLSLRAMAEIPAWVATGRCSFAVDEAGRAFAEQVVLPQQFAIPVPGVHIITQIYGLTECGRLAEAAALASAAYDATPANAPPDGLMWLGHQLGRCALLTGRMVTARRWFSEALARCEEHEIVGPSRLVLSALATACAHLGDATGAAQAVEAIDRLPVFPFVRPEQEMGRAWAKVAAGDLPGGRQVLRDAADMAVDVGYRISEAWLLHDIARLGEPETVVDRLADLAGRCEGDLVAAYAAHAAASVDGRPAPLVDAVERFERIGTALFASEAANEAAQAFQRAGDGRAATAWRVRATALADMCEGARTPAMTAPVSVSPLTPRERDIAALAAHGAASQEIADRLFLSVRTVNNHLQNVYSKLGISGRRQLAAALDDLGEISS